MSALGKQLAGRRYQSKYLLGAKILLPHRLAGTQLTAATPVDVLVFGKRCEYPGCGSAYRCGAVRRNGRWATFCFPISFISGFDFCILLGCSILNWEENAQWNERGQQWPREGGSCHRTLHSYSEQTITSFAMHIVYYNLFALLLIKCVQIHICTYREDNKHPHCTVLVQTNTASTPAERKIVTSHWVSDKALVMNQRRISKIHC